MKNSYPYLKIIEVIKECRLNLIEDTLSSNSPDLYDALYSNPKKEIYSLKLELYEIQWIEMHWKMTIEIIENVEVALSEKKEWISQSAKWYKNFLKDFNYIEFDVISCEERMNILKALIATNREWENHLKRLKVSFDRDKKILNEKIKEIENMEVC